MFQIISNLKVRESCSLYIYIFVVASSKILLAHSPICQSSVLECSSRVELHMKGNTHLSIRKGRLYVHRGVPPCVGGLIHSQCVDWL